MTDPDDMREELAEAFGRDVDPLAEHADTFERMDVDPFELFVADVLDSREILDETVEKYRRVWRTWDEHMKRVGRHPACPTEAQVKSWLQEELDNHQPRTVKEKLRILLAVYRYWQTDPSFPHSNGFNPFELAREKVNFGSAEEKKPPRVSIAELREKVSEIDHVRDRAIVVLQLKLALRATELCNIKLSEVHIANTQLLEHYYEMGTHPQLEGRENAIYIPPSVTADVPVRGREGNKSKRPRVLPLDDETRRVLLRYLLIRPDNGEPWLFLTQSNHNQMDRSTVNRIWKDYFHPEYAESDRHRAITSHFGRHYFTTYWRVDRDVNRELIKYMRGDVTGETGKAQEAIDEYLHSYYEDIEDLYREDIYRLNV